MICRSFKHFSQKHANGFVPLPYQPENNDIPVRTPACRGGDGAGRPPSVALDALRTIAVSRSASTTSITSPLTGWAWG
jgi:hypothetical protein